MERSLEFSGQLYMLIFSALLDWIALILAWFETKIFLDDNVVLECEKWWLHGGYENVDQHGRFNTGTSGSSGFINTVLLLPTILCDKM